MGYRSDIGIKCQEKAFWRLTKVMKEQEMDFNSYHNVYGKEWLITLDWVKWYDNYKDVSAVMTEISKLDEEHNPNEDDELGYEFLRIGEDEDDVERFGNDNCLFVGMVRQIDTEGLERY